MRYRRIAALVSTLTVMQATAEDAPQPGIDVPAAAKVIPYSFVETAPDHYVPLYRYKAGDVTYNLAVDSGIVVYVGTDSSTFKTAENVRVGSSLSEVMAIRGTTEVGSLHSDYSVALPSGWIAIFRYGAKRAKASLSKDAQVEYLFKRRLVGEQGQQ